MSCEAKQLQLTADQKGQITGVLSLGCDRQTAAHIVGCKLSDLRRTQQQDAEFAASIRRAEASAELNHMRNVQEAAKKESNWRASVWWLQQHSPERFAHRGPGVVTARHLKAFVAILDEVLKENVRNDDDRQRISARFQSIVESADQLLRDMQTSDIEPTHVISSPPDAADGDAFDSLDQAPSGFAGES